MPATVHVFLNDPALTERLAAIAAAQRRSQKAIVEIALERYFAELDPEQARQEEPNDAAA